MTNRSSSKNGYFSTYRNSVGRSIQSSNSTRVGGHLKLRSNNLRQTDWQWSMEYFKLVRSDGYTVWDNTGFPSGSLSDGTYSGWTHGPISDAGNRAISKLRLKASDLKINIGQAIAERHQTVRLIGDTARFLASSYHDLRRGNVSGLFKRLGLNSRKDLRKNAENLWLQYSYGWKPLLSDIHGALEASFGRIPFCDVDAHGSSSASGKVSQKTGPYLCDMDFSIDCRAHAHCRLRINDIDAIQRKVFGVDNPALLLWELLPYSFVVDWFIGVGDYLQAANAFKGFDVIDPCITYSTRLSWRSVGRANPSYVTPFSSVFWPESFVSLLKNQPAFTGTQRDKWRDLGLPAVSFNVPDNPLSLNHATSGIALLSQAFRRFK